jgi:hypothetical protein
LNEPCFIFELLKPVANEDGATIWAFVKENIIRMEAATYLSRPAIVTSPFWWVAVWIKTTTTQANDGSLVHRSWNDVDMLDQGK